MDTEQELLGGGAVSSSIGISQELKLRIPPHHVAHIMLPKSRLTLPHAAASVGQTC